MSFLALVLCAGASCAAPRSDFVVRVRPLLERRCFECHAGEKHKGGLDLGQFADEAAARADAATWKLVRARVAAGEMPPPRAPRLESGEVDLLLDWIDSVPGAGKPPGRSVLRRLNRREYENSVRDLLGVDFDGRERLPADDVGAGFDVLGSVLSLPDSALEKYLQAAESIAARAVIAEDPEHPPRERHGPAHLEGGAHPARSAFRALSSNGPVWFDIVLPREGDYVVRARAFGQQAGPERVQMALEAGTKQLARVEVAAVREAPAEYAARAHLPGGQQRISASFLNDYYKPDDPDPRQRDRNLFVEWLEIEGPLDAPIVSSFQRDELGGLSEQNLRATLERLASRAWRRPALAPDVERLLSLSRPDQAPFLRLRAALVGILGSPRFLFRLEPDPPDAAPGSLRRLDGWELATRLSYFLWSSTPDAQLFELAARGALDDDVVLARELERMLADPRAGELVRGFALQWLELEPLSRAAPDSARFPRFDADLRDSMRAETLAFVEAVLRERRPLSELLDADFGFVDERLAQLYGLPGVRGSELRRVRLDRARRGGLLGQASVLTVTSNPTRTSPVKRGKWILEVLLDAPPPPPPPGVGVLEDTARKLADATLRQKLELHRAKPECAVCHDRLDPLGLALENYDAIGAWRESEEGRPIDSSGVLPDGRRIRGRGELVAALLSDGALARSIARRLMVYALGRELGSDDERALRGIVARLGTPRATLYDVLREIVLSQPFRTTRAAEER